MQTPESIKQFSSQYKDNAWKQYSLDELGHFVHLLVKRAGHRVDSLKRDKDLTDAQNYLNMMQAHINSAKEGV